MRLLALEAGDDDRGPGSGSWCGGSESAVSIVPRHENRSSAVDGFVRLQCFGTGRSCRSHTVAPAPKALRNAPSPREYGACAAAPVPSPAVSLSGMIRLKPRPCSAIIGQNSSLVAESASPRDDAHLDRKRPASAVSSGNVVHEIENWRGASRRAVQRSQPSRQRGFADQERSSLTPPRLGRAARATASRACRERQPPSHSPTHRTEARTPARSCLGREAPGQALLGLHHLFGTDPRPR